MHENNLISKFNQAFDLITKGELHGLRLEDEENRDLLALVGKVSKIDYSSDSKIKETIKKHLLIKLKARNNNGELSDKELNYAAGGFDDVQEENDPEKQ